MNEKLLKYHQENQLDSTTLNKFHTPIELSKRIDLAIRDTPMSDEDLLKHVDSIIDLSIRSGHKYFHNQLFQGYDMYTTTGDILTSSINGSMFTYEMAPVFSFMERELFEFMNKHYMKWDTIDGVFTPGGSFANLYALLCARFQAFPIVKKKGIRDLPPMRVFTSEMSHYSIEKGCVIMGMGQESVIKVGAD